MNKRTIPKDRVRQCSKWVGHTNEWASILSVWY